MKLLTLHRLHSPPIRGHPPVDPTLTLAALGTVGWILLVIGTLAGLTQLGVLFP